MPPKDRLEALIAEAESWLEASELPADELVARARSLESMFLRSEKYQYSLEGRIRRSGLDPIEDFVRNTTSTGHCVYFATALALMLRSQEIPARVVNGYVTSELDTRGGFYRVRQRDAHSWVEVYVAPEHLPDALPFGRRDADWRHGGWLRLDPTPPRTAGATLTNLVTNVENWFESVQNAWYEYVVHMDRSRQREAIYDPLKSLAFELRQGLGGAGGWKATLQWIAALPARLRALVADAGWFSWIGLTLLLGTLGFGYVAYRLARWIIQLGGILLPSGPSRTSRRARVAFYRRLEALLARRGLRRLPGQTQREFAVAAGHHLTNGTETDLRASATLVADAFYAVRFGGATLDSIRTQRVEQALRDLEQAGSRRFPIATPPANEGGCPPRAEKPGDLPFNPKRSNRRQDKAPTP